MRLVIWCFIHSWSLMFIIHDKSGTPICKYILYILENISHDMEIHLFLHLRAPYRSMPYI
jgi:hypothetical protein